MATAKTKNLTDKTRALIIAAAGKGCSNRDIMRDMKISKCVWLRWLRDNPELRDEMADARLPRLEDIEAALYKRAIGYSYVETTEEERSTAAGLQTVTKTVTKQIAGDVSAQTFILQNRRSDRWRPAHKIDEDNGRRVYLVSLPE